MNARIKSIYKEYYSLLHSYLVKERAILRDDNFREHLLKGIFLDMRILMDMVTSRGTFLDSNGNGQFFIGEEIQKAHVNVLQFWRLNGEEFNQILRSENNSSRVAIPNRRLKDLQNLPIYFDSVLIQDPFQIARSNPELESIRNLSLESEQKKLFKWSHSLGDYLMTYQFVSDIIEQDLDTPIHYICPRENYLYTDSITDMKNVSETVKLLCFENIKHVTNINAHQSYNEFVGYISNLSSENLYSILVNLDEQGFTSKCLSSTTGLEFLEQFDRDIHDPASCHEQFQTLLTLNMQRFLSAVDLDSHSQTYGAVRGASKCEWHALLDYTSTQQGLLSSEVGFSKEYAMMRTIENGSISMFNNLTYSDFVKLREKNAMSDIRDFFRVQSQHLSRAGISDYENVCESIASDFHLRLEEESQRISLDSNLMKRKYKLTSASFVASFSIGLSTALFPAIAVLSIPVAIASGILGGSSALDIIKLHLSQKKTKKELSNRPISFFHELSQR